MRGTALQEGQTVRGLPGLTVDTTNAQTPQVMSLRYLEIRNSLRTPRLPPVLHRLGKRIDWQRIENVVFGEPRAARLKDSKTNLFQMRGVV